MSNVSDTEAGVDVDVNEKSAEAPTQPPTKKLAFDKETTESDVPKFLRKGAKKKIVEPEEEEHQEHNEGLESEPVTPISGEVSTDNEAGNEKMENLNLGTTPIPGVVNDAALQNLAELSIEQLKAQQAEIDRKITEKQTAERQAVIGQIVTVVNDYNIPVEELVEALGGMKLKRKGTKAKAKYRDPVSGITWSGRGKEPAWIKGAVDRTPFEI